LLKKQFANVSAVGALGGGLVIICLWPEAGNVSVILAQILALGICFFTSTWSDLRRPAAALPLLAGLLLIFAFGITATSVLQVASVLVFAPLFLVGPLITAFQRTSIRIGPGIVGGAATLGAFFALAVAAYDVGILHSDRGGGLVANPIHFADVTLVLGAISLVGLFAGSPRKYIVLAGPVLAAAAILLSGSRGAMVTVLPVALVALALAAVWGGLPRRAWLAVGVLAVVAVAMLGFAAQAGWGPLQRTVETITAIAGGGDVTDGSDSQRVLMYRGAYNAFLQSPFYGHGMIGFTKIAADTLPPELHAPVYDHLHNDIADFAVTGGLLGIIAYFCILLAPVAEALRASGPGRRPALLGACCLSVGYFFLGLTNATFGILMLTVTFAVATAAIAHLARLPARDLSQAPDVLNTPRSPHRLADAPIA